MKTRTEITVEMDRWVVRQPATKRLRWCSTCSRHVEMLSVDEAAIFASVNSRTDVSTGPSPQCCTRMRRAKDYYSFAPQI